MCSHISPAESYDRTSLSSFQPFAVKRALEEAKMKAVDVDGIAFTRGPGKAIVKIEKYVLIV